MTVLLASAVFLLDRFTKFIAVFNLTQGESMKVIPGIFHLTLVLNDGTVFGLLKDRNIFFAILSALIIFILIVYLWKHRSKNAASAQAIGLILGGAIGNLVDRIAYGRVIDFLDFRIWPVFNIADSAITIGSIILVWSILKQV